MIALAIKGGDLIHIGNQFLIDRAQTAGPGQVTINREKIYELGNYFSLTSIADTPDLTFNVESYDASAELEAILVNKTFSVANGTQKATITGNPTGGTFTLTYGAQTTSPGIAYNASAAAVQAALEALSNLAPGDITVTGSASTGYTIAFSSTYLGSNTATNVTASGASLTGGTTPAVGIARSEGVAMADGTALKPASAVCLDIASAFKPGSTASNLYDVIGSVSIPFLQLESLQYQFGISDLARQTVTLRGSDLYYSAASTFIEEFTGTNAANQTITLAYTPTVYKGDTTNGNRYALAVSLNDSTRLIYGSDYTESLSGGVLTITVIAAVPATKKIRVSYASNQASTYPQASHAPVTAVRPAALRGRNIEVYIGGTSLGNRWTSVQSVNIQWQVSLEKDEELGNQNAVSQTYDVPQVSGSVDLKPRNYAELYNKICTIAGVTPGEVAGALTTAPLSLIVVLHSPDDGTVLKTIEIPDARFNLPGYSGQAGNGQKLTVSFSFEGDTGDMTVYKGAKP